MGLDPSGHSGNPVQVRLITKVVEEFITVYTKSKCVEVSIHFAEIHGRHLGS